MLLNTGHLADLFNISPSTVKKYSGIYGRFLSEAARPQDGAHRLFDADDVRIMAYVVQQTKLGEKHDNIIMSVANGARADTPSQYGDFALTMDKGEQIMLLQNRVTQLTAEVETLRSYRDESVKLQALLDRSEAQLVDLQGKVDRLIGENAVLKSNNNHT